MKQQLNALVKIGEKLALLLMGTAALTLSLIDSRFETLRLYIQVIGIVCLLFALIPMAWAYIQANWPTDKK